VLSRRRFVSRGLGGATALVVGFDPVGRGWVAAADAECSTFADAPRLDGILLLDAASREADAADLGNIAHRTPCAVLRPGSVADIQQMIRYCRRHNIKVACRGQHHTTHGQGLTPGLIIENRWLNTIHSIRPRRAVVESGVIWKDLLEAAFEQRLKPRGVTGYTALSIGGTLSVGGCPLTNHEGGLVDHVEELEVVTGRGDVMRCSADDHSDLFEAALAGLGQCGVITRATVDLVPALPMARTYLLPYTDNATFFRDMRTLFDRGELNEVYTVCVPPGLSAFVYQISATVFFDPSNPPDNDRLLRGLSVAPAATMDQSYLDYALLVDRQIEALRIAVNWDALVKPWFDAWLPEPAVESYVGDVLGGLTARDVGPGGFVLVFAQRRSRMTRPFFRVPDAAGADRVWLFDILTSSALPGPDPLFADEMLARNRRLFDRARALGGTRYPIGALTFDQQDWIMQYGNQWAEFARRKQRFDPDNILTPGPGIF
jgi:cytokinin dehydrogenase